MKGRFWRKTLAAALALLVVSGNVPIRSVADLFGGAAITASAEEAETSGQCGANATWELDLETDTLTISGTGDMADYYDINDQPWYNYKDNITSVEIEKGITSIGFGAFDSFAKLTSVSIPDSVKSIDNWAFSGCTSLTSITIPGSVTSIGNQAFYKCTGLTSITIPDSVKSIGISAFYKCTSLESITIPDSVTSIGDWAFKGCTSLKSITIPEKVTSIGSDAFVNCTNITDVYCYANPANLAWNEDYSDDFIRSETGNPTICHVREEYLDGYNTKFGAGSENPVNVTFKAEKMDKCGDHAYWCFESDAHKLTISGTGAMKEYYFNDDQPWYNYKDNITSVEIESGITSIGKYAFFDCTSLTSITIPDSVKSIGERAFMYCTSLTSITIPDSVTSIGERAFMYCASLTSITIPDSVTSISNYAFDFCEGLTSITIPDSVTSIGDYAFNGCESLKSITIPEKVTSIGEDAFCNCTGITDVYCYADPDTLTWNERNCNDFMGARESRETVCHVPKMYLDDYEAKFGAESETPVNVRFVGDVDMGLGEHLYGHSITLDGSIGVNFYVELTDELLESEIAQMVFTVPNGSKTDTQTLLVKDVIANDKNKVSIGSKTYYKFKCSVSAKDMASEITAQLVNGDKAGTEYKYSVKDYADYLLSHTEVEEYADAAPLVKAMLNYGAASQRYFNEGTPVGEVQDMVGVTVPNTFEFNEDNAALPEGVTFEGATLSLKSETTLSLYFKGLPADTKFTCGDKTVETAKNGEYVVARIRGIKASELENDFTVTFKGESMTYNAMTYCYNVLNGGSDNEDLQNVCKALYLYAQAAINYAG